MLGKTTTALLIVSLGGCHPAFAEAPCEYDKTVETNWTQQIEKTSNIDKKVFPYVDDTRKCVMTMDVTIEGTTYPTDGNYVFGPDMTENDACEQATIKAKKKVIGEVSPEVLTARTEMNCSTKEELPVHAAAPQPEVTITESSPVITERIINEPVVTERIISRKIVDVTPSTVVQYIPNRNKGITIGGITLTFDPHSNKRGKCYANWQTGGTDCY
jgi:hypothetical protein